MSSNQSSISNKEANRIRLAELTRQFAIGRISNDQFEDGYLSLENLDDDLHHIFDIGLWTLYSDGKEYHASENDALTKNERLQAAKIILFLRSGLNYRWPSPIIRSKFYMRMPTLVSFSICISVILTLLKLPLLLFLIIPSLTIINWHRKIESMKSKAQDSLLGDFSVWPFFTRKEYINALNNPIYLANND